MRILVVTDSHLAATADAFVDNWRAVGRYAEGAAIDLTIHLGDITLDAINQPTQLDEARALIAAWPTPIRCIPGNHDIGDNRDADGIRESEWYDEAKHAAYRARFGDDHWSLDEAGWKLIALDSLLFGSGTAAEDAQWRWLDRQLTESAGRPVVVALHKPMYEDLARDRDRQPRLVPQPARGRLFAAFKRADVRLVLCGHAHQFLDRVLDGVRHVWFPSCAFIIPDDKQRRLGEKFTGVGVLELAPDDYRLEVVIPDRVVRHDIVAYRGLLEI